MTSVSEWVIGVDLGDRESNGCRFRTATGEIEDFRFPTTREGITERFSEIERCQVVIEAGSQTRWVAQAIKQLDFDVRVLNPRRNELIKKSLNKTDKSDARCLARIAACSAPLVQEVQMRSDEAQKRLTIIRARDRMVSVRTKLASGVRGLAKQFGHRFAAKSPSALWKSEVPDELKPALDGMMLAIRNLSELIARYDQEIEATAQKQLPQVAPLSRIPGVGVLTAMAFVLLIEDPKRFKKSRDVGAYFGLRPRQFESGDSRKLLGITKTGDRLMRRLLVQCAAHILGPFGKDSDLRRYGLAMIERGGRAANKRARVAVARKLAVMMHRMWVDGTEFRPLKDSTVASAAPEPPKRRKRSEAVKPSVNA